MSIRRGLSLLVFLLLLFLLAFFFLSPGRADGQQLDSIPVPYPVAVGGAFWHVLVDWESTSQHTTLHGGLREGGLRRTECEASGEPCDVRVCSDPMADGFCYRVELRWVEWAVPDTVADPPADTVLEPPPDTVAEPEPEPEPEPEEALGDSLSIVPSELVVDSAETETFSIIVWHEERPWACVDLVGQVGLLARQMEHGSWTWDYPVPDFIPSALSCDIEVGSTDTTVVTVDWAPLSLSELPTRPVQYLLQSSSANGQTPTVTLGFTPEPGSLLVAMLAHRVDWQTPELQSDREWTRVVLEVEDEAEVSNLFRKGMAVWVRRAGPDEPRTVSATWADMEADTDRVTHLAVWELDGYGDFIDATVASTGAGEADHLALSVPGDGALVGLVATRNIVLEAAWEGLENGHRIPMLEGMTVLSATGSGQDATAFFGELFAAIGALLRFQHP